MGKVKSLATEADYASVLRTANKLMAENAELREEFGKVNRYHDVQVIVTAERETEIERLRSLNAEMMEALKECQTVLAMLTEPKSIRSSTVYAAWGCAVAAELKARNAVKKAEG